MATEQSLAQVRVTKKGAQRVESGHPWIFLSDVTSPGSAAPGDLVRVVDPRGTFLGLAHYSSSSQITLRFLSRGPAIVDRAFFLARMKAAQTHRELVVRDSDSYRLVYGEGDQLPGLVIDRYGDYLVLQSLNQGMDRVQPEIVSCLEEMFRPRGIIARNDGSVRKLETLPQETKVVSGEIPERAPMRMNGFQLDVDLEHGQKTGVYLDQRENYLAAAQYAHGRALDCFSSTGGFALHMARQCDSVEAVDSSAPALETAATNFRNNGIANVTCKVSDAFELLANYSRLRSTFQTIVLDPPAFAKSRSNVEAALRGYKDINLRALRILSPGGILVTCSCSHHISEAALMQVLAEAALDSGRVLRILERRSQAMDHPILLTVPETLYLKCLIVQVL